MPWCILGPFARFPSISDYTEFVRKIYRDFLCKSIDCEGNSKTLPTEKGVRLGISVKKIKWTNGSYDAVLYNAKAQKFIIDNIFKIIYN